MDKKKIKEKQQPIYEMERDTILKEGLTIRRRSTALFLANIICLLLAWEFRTPFVDFPIIAFMVCSFLYSRSFYAWERRNADYLRMKGFTVKGV